MADNTTLDSGSGGDTLATASLAFSGDTAKFQICASTILSGSEGSWSQTLIVGGAGAVGAGVQRVTLASDDPAVALLTTIDSDTSKITACNTGAVVLATGSAAIGKLASNTGVDIGDVDVTSIVPGTAATNLGKAIDSVVGATDTGVALLGRHSGDNVHVTTADGDYDIVGVSDFGGLQVTPEQHHTFDSMDATSGWTALGNDTLNLATTKKHVLGTDALTFDKVNGAANTIFAGIQKTLSSTDLGDISPHDLIQATCYLPVLTNVAYVFVRLGTDSSHCNEWRVAVDDLTAATFETLALSVGDPNYTGITGNGWTPAAITYIAVGVAFDAETNTLAGIVFDEVSFHTNQHTSATVNAEVTSSVSSANVNLLKVGGKVVDKGAGNVSNGSQRVVLADDDTNAAAIKTAVELSDDTVKTLGTDTYSEGTTKGNAMGAVRNDDKATLANTDNEIAPLQVDNEGALYVNQAAAENKSASGVAAGGTPGADNMIGAVAGKKLLVTAMSLVPTSTTTNNIFVDNADNDLYGNVSNPIPMSMDADGDKIAGIVLPYNPAGWFKTDTVNEAVTLNTSAAQDIVWSISWIETD